MSWTDACDTESGSGPEALARRRSVGLMLVNGVDQGGYDRRSAERGFLYTESQSRDKVVTSPVVYLSAECNLFARRGVESWAMGCR